MFLKFEDSYNPKIDFLLLKYLNPKYNSKKNYNELKKIFFKKQKAKSIQGKYLEKLIEIFEILKIKDININTLKECADILGVNMLEEKANDFIKYLNSLNMNVTKNSVWLLVYLLKNEIFNLHSDFLSVLIFNSYLYKNKYVPFILYHYNREYIKKKLDNGANEEGLHFYFSNFYNENKVFLNKYPKLTKKELIDKLVENKKVILGIYNVSKLWIYGSFARDDANEYSDIDLYLELSEYDLDNLTELKKFLERILLRRVDFHIEHYQKYTFFNNVYEERELVLNKEGEEIRNV